MFGSRGTSGDEADGTDDEKDSGPAIEAKVLMEPEAAEKSDDDVAEGGGGHDEGEVGPGKRRHVAGEETDEEEDARGDEGVEESVPETVEMVKINGTDLGHATGEESITDRGCEHDGQQNEIALGRKGVLHVVPV